MGTLTALTRRNELLAKMELERVALFVPQLEGPARRPTGVVFKNVELWATTGLLLLASAVGWPKALKGPVRTIASVSLRNRVAALMARPERQSEAQQSKEQDMVITASGEGDFEQDFEAVKRTGRRTGRNLKATGRQFKQDAGDNLRDLLDSLETSLRDGNDGDVEALRARLRTQLDDARDTLGDAADTANNFVRETIDTAEEYVQVRPWQALGMVAGAAFLLGVIVGRN